MSTGSSTFPGTRAGPRTEPEKVISGSLPRVRVRGIAIEAGPATLEGRIREVDEHGFDELVATSDRLLVVEFFMDGCPACRTMAPILDDLARELSGEVEFVRVDARANLDTALRYGVVATPTFLVFCRGVFLMDMVGVIHPAVMAEVIDDLLKHREECAGGPMRPLHGAEG